MNTNHTLTAALSYAKKGWAVMPLWAARGNVCECEKGESCGTPGKHPRIKNWQDYSTTNTDIIGRWWTKWPGAGVGIQMGAKSGIVAVDDDPRNGGEVTLAELEGTYGRLPETVTNHTGGDGRHFIYKHPGGTIKNGKLGPGLDIKGDNGMIVAPPTVHASGRAYTWNLELHPDDMEPAELPDWCLKKMATTAATTTSTKTEPGAKIKAGGRDQHLASLAGSMRRRGMTETEILAALETVNEERCEPQLSGDDVQRIAKSIAKYEPAETATTPEVLAPGAHQNDQGEYFEVGVDKFSDAIVTALPDGDLYRRGNAVGTLDAGGGDVEFQTATEPRIRNLVDASVRIVSWQQVGRGKERHQALVYKNCSQDHAGLIRDAALRSHGIRQLEVIPRYPVFHGPDMRLATPGWNKDGGIYYDEPDELQNLVPIRGKERIRSILLDLVVDFPFDQKARGQTKQTDASLHNYFGALLTPMLVPAIHGNLPQHHAGASLERTGKGKLLGETTGFVYLNKPIPPTIWPGDEAEREKRIISLLRRGENFMLLDNLDQQRELDSAILAALLTARSYTGRLLSVNEMPNYPNNMVIFSTGNNSRFSAEIAKRMVLIRLVPRDDHPEDRQDFVHPDLQGHVRAVRRDVLGALIGMVENWKAAGAPLHPKPMGGFEHWAGMVGGILAHHGFTDWRGNEKAFRREADPEGADLSALVEAWADKWPDTKVRTTELLELCRELGVFGRVFMTKNDTGAALSLSKTVLRAYQDRPVGTWCIRSSGSGSNSLYFLEWAA